MVSAMKACLTLALALLTPQLFAATITVDLSRKTQRPAALPVHLECEGGGRRSGDLAASGTLVFRVDPRDGACRVSADPVPGRQLVYRADGGSDSDDGESGCLFSRIATEDTNFCLVLLQDEITRVSVFARWIGANGEEAPVEAHLFCEGMGSFDPVWVNQKDANGWRLPNVPTGGVICDVVEVRREEFLADMSDCRDLLVMPGAHEECTLVNTKIVKRIEMLNRYGKVVMVVIFLAVGLLAARRFS
jgi:hypothetical protein